MQNRKKTTWSHCSNAPKIKQTSNNDNKNEKYLKFMMQNHRRYYFKVLTRPFPSSKQKQTKTTDKNNKNKTTNKQTNKCTISVFQLTRQNLLFFFFFFLNDNHHFRVLMHNQKRYYLRVLAQNQKRYYLRVLLQNQKAITSQPSNASTELIPTSHPIYFFYTRREQPPTSGTESLAASYII